MASTAGSGSGAPSYQTQIQIVTNKINAIARNVNEARKLPQTDPERAKRILTATRDARSADDDISNLKAMIDKLSGVPSGELDRRRSSIAALETRLRQRQGELMRLASAGMPASPLAAARPTQEQLEEETRHLTETALLDENERLLNENDKKIEGLLPAVRRIKQSAQGMGDEIDRQDVLLDDLGEEMDHANERIVDETNALKKFGKAAKKNWPFFLVIAIFLGLFLMLACTHWGCDIFTGAPGCK